MPVMFPGRGIHAEDTPGGAESHETGLELQTGIFSHPRE